MRFFSNFTSMCSKYLSNNIWRDHSNVNISNGNVKYPSGKSIFAVNLLLKLFPATVANADIGSQKSLHTLFDTYLNHRLVKFEQNCMVQTTRNLELFWQKPGFFNHFYNALTPFWKTFLWLKQLFNGTLLISRQSSFSVPKITVVRHV